MSIGLKYSVKMERENHSIIYDWMREFKHLRRQYRVFEREGRIMDMDLYNRMLDLDEQPADNCPEWHQNYPDLEKRDI